MLSSINSVYMHPQKVKTGDRVTIEVNADLDVTFNTLSQMTWNTIEERRLTWNNINPSLKSGYTFNELEDMTWNEIEAKGLTWNGIL